MFGFAAESPKGGEMFAKDLKILPHLW